MSTDTENRNKFPFSRQGPLILSDVEDNITLQEFFTNAVICLQNKNNSNRNDDGVKNGGSDHVSLYKIGLVKLICFMVQTLIESGKIDITKTEYPCELQTLLMNWECVILEAEELFSTIKSSIEHKNVNNNHSKNSNEICNVDNENDDESSYYFVTNEEIESCDFF